MSWHASQWAQKQAAGSPVNKALLRAIADKADVHGHAIVKQRYLASACEISIDTVQRHLPQLESRGLISREKRRRKDGGNAEELIVLKMPRLRAEESAPMPHSAVGGSRSLRDDPTATVRQAPAAHVRSPYEEVLEQESRGSLRSPEKRASRAPPNDVPLNFNSSKGAKTHEQRDPHSALAAARRLREKVKQRGSSF